MKKIIIIVFLISSFTGISNAYSFPNIYFDGFGAFLSAGDAKLQYGGGGGVGLNIIGDYNLMYRFMYTLGVVESGTIDEEKYTQMKHKIGIEYIYFFSRLGWKNSIYAGISSLKEDYFVGGIKERRDDLGITAGISTGIIYIVTQSISPFVEAGYHYSSFGGSFKDEKIHGISILAGIRITIGMNKRLSSGY